jgi:4-amino-4-deoxy-L-arabinose transferase-like glycosyltransferase
MIELENRRDLYILGSIWLFHVCANAIWLILDKFPPSWDSAHHLTMTLSWLDFFKAPSLIGLKAVLGASSYPPLSYLIITPFYLLFGKSPDVAVFVSGALWLGLLLFATYGIGKEVYNRKSGLLAAIIVSLYPIIITLERDFWVDLQLAAAVTLALWALIRVNDFDHRMRAIVLGLTLGFGTWIKWPFAFFVIAPFLAVIILVFQHGGWSKQRIINLGICLAIAGAMTAGQFLANLLFLSSDLYTLNNLIRLITGFAEAADHPAWYTREGVVFNFMALVNHQATFFFVLLFLFSLPAFFRRDVRNQIALSLGILIPYIFATLLPIKEQRITAPYLPIIAVVSAVGLAKIRWKSLQRIAIILVVGFGLFQWWMFSWGCSFLPDHIYWGNTWVHFAILDQHPVRSPRDYSLQPGDWKIEQIIDAIELDAVKNRTQLPTKVPLVANTAAYNPNTFNYFSTLYKADVQFLYVWSWFGEPLSLQHYPYSYLVWKSGQNFEVEGWDKQDVKRAEEYLANQQGSLALIYKSGLPDGSEVQVFRREENARRAP